MDPARILAALTNEHRTTLHALAHGARLKDPPDGRLFEIGFIAIDQDNPHGSASLTLLGSEVEQLDRDLRGLSDDFEVPDV